MILVLLGTQNNSFHRLLEEIDKCIDEKIIEDEVIVQSGFTRYKSSNMKVFDLIPLEELDKLIDKADLIITHGGVGSIIDSLKRNKKVIAVSRLKEYREHINNHQLEVIEEFARKNFILGVQDAKDIRKAVIEAKDFVPKKYESGTSNIINIIDNFIKSN